MYDDARTDSIPVPDAGQHFRTYAHGNSHGNSFGNPQSVGNPLGVTLTDSDSESFTLGHDYYDGHAFAPAGDARINGARPCAVRGCDRWPSTHALPVGNSHDAGRSRSFLSFWPMFWASLSSSCVSVLFWSVIFPWLAYLVA